MNVLLTPALGHVEWVHQDHRLLVVNKPSGLMSVPGRGADKQDCMAARVVSHCPDARVVHRLDMSTSGLMVFARDLAAQQDLGKAFAERRVHKHYVAVVAGKLAHEQGEIDLPLLTDWPRRPLQKVDWAQGKAALTRYRVLHHDALQDTSRLMLEPITGRTHQLRVHLWAMGHPILGDALYAPADVRERSARLMLHAESIHLPHPDDGVLMSFTLSVPF